ncbi:carbohydrate ABC transporter permease [Oceanomicrobium pacificus]|uniref:Maltose/maltodextrin transport system permease protein MalG n=1 Tax=Oceanomicrobium pacificus TaxID=2692916 RepID=A0A6B0TJ12_9RHOB|nr:carbohydrate ABC transporter permease [Oceanomicrobium pacificus]MXU64367.1 ABC transporter permease subunit [Oceanomicrobium pacificus]
MSTRRPGLFEPRAIGQMAPATKILLYTILIVWAAFVLFPIYWLLITSVKTPAAVNQGPFFLPFIDFEPSLHAWKELFVIDYEDTLRAYMNSIIISLSATALSVLVGSMAAYALSRVDYAPNLITILYFVALLAGVGVAVGIYDVDWMLATAVAVALFFLLARAVGRIYEVRLGNGDILFWIISQRILAPIVVVVPIYMMFQSVRLLDTHLAIILTYAVVNLPIVVWLMYDFFNSIPRDLEESAQIDGATMIGTFREIILPLSRAGLAATTLLVMILSWNEYLLALFLSTTKAQTMPILVAAMNAGERGVLWWTMSVTIVVMIIPVVVLAVILQKYITKGLLVGAVKG